MTEQDRYTELYETWCRVDLINLVIKLEQEKERQHDATNTNNKHQRIP